ncbi:hypothetical protein TRIP_C60009 [Candidatus Zixiibacteriota bacterium]|nr:hypothetical protein TRIP_C60009 [candidate division Zixibacteria bacterium]
MQKVLTGIWLKKTGRIFAEYLTPSQWYIFLNDSVIYFFSIRRSRFHCLISTVSDGNTDTKDLILNFAQRLKVVNFGQPVTLLIGGSFNFFEIEISERMTAVHPAKAFPWLDLENTEFNLRILPGELKNRISYSAAVKKDIGEFLLNEVKGSGVDIEEFLPVSYLILRQWLKSGTKENVAVRLPGEAIYLYYDKSNISIIEKACDDESTRITDWRKSTSNIESAGNKFDIPQKQYLLSIDGKKPKNENVENVAALLKDRIIDFKGKRGFFSLGPKKDAIDNLIPAMNILRILGLFVAGAALILLAFWGALRLSAGNNDIPLTRYYDQNAQKNSLLSEIDSLTGKLKNASRGEQSATSFAGAISAFCQTKPSGLYLSDLTVSGDKDEPWQAMAQGVSQKENTVLEYRESIAKFAEGYPVDITLLKRLAGPALNPGEAPRITYGFRLRLRLSANEKD